jgi:hypothetical protein
VRLGGRPDVKTRAAAQRRRKVLAGAGVGESRVRRELIIRPSRLQP